MRKQEQEKRKKSHEYDVVLSFAGEDKNEDIGVRPTQLTDGFLSFQRFSTKGSLKNNFTFLVSDLGCNCTSETSYEA